MKNSSLNGPTAAYAAKDNSDPEVMVDSTATQPPPRCSAFAVAVNSFDPMVMS